MPKFFGVSVVGLLAATFVFYMLGAVWYGYLFAEEWLILTNITEEAAASSMEKLGAMMWIWGILITVFQVCGIAMLLNMLNKSDSLDCVKFSAVLAFVFALPVMGYGSLYESSPIHLLGINFSHTLVGFMLVGAILSFFRSK